MRLPFVSRKLHDATRDELSSGYNDALDELGAAQREVADLQDQLAAQSAAEIIREGLLAIAESQQALAQAVDVGTKLIQHSVGAAATALDKTANANREWIEQAKGNR